MTSPEPARFLFLFDIDGTLILGGGAGEGALRRGMEKAFGRTAGFDTIVLAGATDKSIAMQLLSANDLPVTEENIASLLEHYLEALEELMPTAGGALLPGILQLLEELHRMPECALGLLTGNVRQGAQIKLSHFGVWHFFPFGAFSDDHHERNELGHFAAERARQHHGESFAKERIFVLGDTPRDIECGRAIGARTVAIATGNYSREQLAAHNPDLLFDDLSRTHEVVATLLAAAQ